MKFKVTWSVEIDAPSFVEAAKIALELQRDINTTDTVFNVTALTPFKPRPRKRIDVADLDRKGLL